MTEDDYHDIVQLQEYGAPKSVTFDANSRSTSHTHDLSSFVFVVSGEFILNTAEGAPRYYPGDTVILPANVEHAEEAGPEGATILVARK